ncbi:FKBP-type peptidyl-prolyl cis-trans isomerase [Pseudomarimonas salicorniae]|uniref:Peptidyl-prolyl cis-trans isomerase n=1 Tax=Pseudomarimonas salicorniae TaxID=2933270 RepID=A0ABT0GF10_9GAMM|nr:peptidylprolyl isomerase [Lysobacter sp. CAU 1642]MCK7593138.1 peptidylprolyl isomerase [Lysobacter sp. CAU 1642]
MQIAENTAVSFHYTLTNDAGEVIDTSSGREPLAYLHGSGTIVPGLENAMAGRKPGERFEVKVEPSEGYGERHEGMIQAVPRSAFQGVDSIEVGMQFQARGPQGVMSVTVTEVSDDQVTVDGNHPLAGQNLNFAIEVVEVREASEEEIAHGHIHGPGGHQH